MSRFFQLGFLRLWAGCFTLCFLAPLLLAQSEGRIKQIVIENIGPPACSDAMVLANMRLKVGESYTRNSIDDDVRSLYATGLFYNIQVMQDPLDEGIKLTYKLQGKPTLTQILFSGNKVYSDKKLLKKVGMTVGEPLDERKVFTGKQEIIKQYTKSGRGETKVDPVVVIDAKLGRGTVTYEIQEAAKVKIKEVEFVGAHAFKQSKLRKVIKTRRHWWLSWLTGSGILKPEQFDEDKERLREFYQDAGFMDFEIKDVQFETVDKKWLIIKFIISEGQQYRVGGVTLEGNKTFDTMVIFDTMVTKNGQKFSVGLSMGPGAVFSPRGLARDREGIEDFYGTRGYIEARVAPQRIPNIEKGTIDILYRIDEGQKQYVEQIMIRGNTKTKDKVIRRELAVYPGEVFDMLRVKISTNRLAGLNYFAKVDAQPEPTEVVDHKNLVIGVEEKNTGDIRLGAGFSSVDALVGFVEVSQGNFDLFKPPLFFGTGAGQKIRLRVQYGTQRQDYVLTFIEPWFLGRKLALSTDLYYRQLDYYSSLYNVRLAGGKVGLSRTLWNDFWVGSVSYTLENVGLVDMPNAYMAIAPGGDPVRVDPVPPQIRVEEGYTLVSKIGSTIAWDTRNNALMPSRGQRTALLAELAGGPFGGDTDFYKLELTHSRYLRGFAPGHILELGGRVGVVQTYGGDPYVRLFDRWFLGGMYSLRGYKYRTVGPYDYETFTQPVGGDTSWFATAEYSIPIIERLRFALFYDVGNVYPNAYSFQTQGPRFGFYTDDYGVGIRLNIPSIGPLRLDYAIPLTHDFTVSGSGRFQFGIGYTRDF